jgi:methyl-accepting chemotaxis protein
MTSRASHGAGAAPGAALPLASTTTVVSPFNRPESLRVRFGIKIKLQSAFGIVAALTVLAAAVAIISFSATERGLRKVASREVPIMTDAMRLSVASGEISAAAARFVSATTAADQKQISVLIAEKSRELKLLIDRLRAAGGDSAAFAEVESVAKRLDVNLDALEKAISQRSALRDKLEAELDTVHKVHSRIGDKLVPIVDDSYFDVVMTAEDVGKSGDRTVKSLVGDGLQLLQTIIQIGAEVNLVTGLLTASALTSSPPILALLEDRFIASARRAQKNLAKLPADAKFAPVKSQVDALVRLADFKPSAETRSRDSTERLNKVFRVHETLTALLITLVDDLNFDLVLHSEDAVKRSSSLVKEMVDNQISGLRAALEVSAQTHLIASLISEGVSAREAAFLAPIQDRFVAASGLARKASARVANDEITKAIGELLAFGQGADGAFALRARELAATAAGERTIKENADLQRELDQAVAAFVGEAEAATNQGAATLIRDLNIYRTLLFIVAMASIVAAAGIGVFYVQRRLVRRLTSVGDAMRLLSSGQIDMSIPAVDDRDEIGEMARSLEVFRAAEIERRGFAERQSSEQAAQRKRAIAIEEMINEFRGNATQVFNAVSENVSRMEETAHNMSSIASRADREARSASSASEQTSFNVRSVAAAAEELGTSIGEISRRAAEAKLIVDRASAVARSADQLVGQLSAGASRVGDVIQLIRSIAEQTNLLALNATIEAARAGEMGRGFSVVASEVKTLSTQTARATEEVTSHIGAIQGSTRDAVEAIHSIGAVMDDINAFTATIAAAVEEQSASTQEIARNVQQAATGANDLVGNLTTVAGAINDTNRSAAAVLQASQLLSDQSGTMQMEIDSFLQKVSAA